MSNTPSAAAIDIEIEGIDITAPENAHFVDAHGYVYYDDSFGLAGFHIETPVGEGNGWFGKEHFKLSDTHIRRQFARGARLISTDVKEVA